MSTPKSPMRRDLESRWLPQFDKHSISGAAKKHFEAALNVIDKLEARHVELGQDKSLSDFGRGQEMQKLAKALAPQIAKAGGAVSTAKQSIQKQRLATMPAVKDKGDVRSMMLRQEIRTMLRTKPSATVMEIANDPNVNPLVLEAIFEDSFLVPNLESEHRNRILATMHERSPAPLKAALSEQTGAIEVLETAVGAAQRSLGVAAGVPEHGFNQWLQEIAPADAAAAAHQFNSEVVTQSALSLPYDARKALIDTLLDTNTAEILGPGKAA